MKSFSRQSASVGRIYIALCLCLVWLLFGCQTQENLSKAVYPIYSPNSQRKKNILESKEQMIWQNLFAGEMIHQLVGSDELLYLRSSSFKQPGRNGKVLILKVESGQLMKEVLSGGRLMGMFLDQGSLFIMSKAGVILAYDAANGQKLWESQVEYPVENGSVLDGELLLIASVKGNVTALDKATGQVRWKFESNGSFPTTAIKKENTIYFGVQASVLEPQSWIYSLDYLTGKLLRRFSSPCFYPSALAEASNNLILYDLLNSDQDPNPKTLYALNMSDNSLKWKFETGKAMPVSLLATGTGILIGTDKGDLYLLDPVSGKLRVHKKFGGSVSYLVSGPDKWIWLTVSLPQGKGGQLWKFHPRTHEALLLSESEASFSALSCFGTFCFVGSQRGAITSFKSAL